MRIILTLVSVLLLCCSCGWGNGKEKKENLSAIKTFQGIWLDSDSETVLLRVEGDSIYYADPQAAPVHYKIRNDSLIIYGSDMSRYKIDKQTAYEFWFHSITDNVVKLHKSEEDDDRELFSDNRVQVISLLDNFAGKDTVLAHDKKKYSVSISASHASKTVAKSSYSEEGLSVDNVYYDHIVRINIKEGQRIVCSGSIAKQDFEDIVPADFLAKSVLSNIIITSVNDAGFNFVASVCIPASSICFMADVLLGFEGKKEIRLVE